MNRKTKLIAILFAFLILAPLTLAAIPVKAAQYTNLQDSGGIPLPVGVTADQTVQTIAQMSFTPNPIGIGQQLLVNVWLHPPLQVSRYMKDALQVTFTRPDGTTQYSWSPVFIQRRHISLV